MASALDQCSFRIPTQIRFGPGARRAALAEFCDTFAVRYPLLVTDGGLTGTQAFRDMAAEMDRLWHGAWKCYSGVHPNPLEQDVEEGFEQFRDGDCDAVIGLGGGSGLDAAKAVRLKVAFPTLRLADIPLAEMPRLAPFCAVPTTAGTGSEVGRSSVITLPALGRKVVLGGNPMMPDLAILDAELTVGLPPHLTAATGMDAMTHAIESFVCPLFHPMCDAIALEAVRMVNRYLPQAVANGSDLEARGVMLIAASMGAVAFQKDLGAAHSLAHPLSTEFGVHHGLANAVVLPTVIRFNGEVDSGQYRRVVEALELSPSADPAAQAADAVEALNRRIGITQRLRDLKIPQESLRKLASKAVADGCHLTNPRPCTEADLLALYERAW